MKSKRVPRILPVPADAPELMAAAPLAARGAKGSNAIATILRNRDLYDVWRPFARYINAESMIPVRKRELMILRVSWLASSEYEWGNHVLVGRQAGLTDLEIAAIAVGAQDSSWGDEDLLLLITVDELFKEKTLSDDTWKKISKFYSNEEILEIIMIVGHYLMLALVLNAAAVQREDGVPGFELAEYSPHA